MKRWVNGLVVVAVCATGFGIPSARAGAQESRVTVKSAAPFGKVAEALERAVAGKRAAGCGRTGCRDQRQPGTDGLPE
jgi:hypothetical protein